MKTLALALALVSLTAQAKPETFNVDTKASTAKWEGKKVMGAHQGELQFKSGELKVEKGAIVGGTVEIDMTTLKNNDLTDPENNTKLVNHLKNDDFFSVDKHPTSSLKITKVAKEKGQTMVTGELTIKGKPHPISFPADISVDKTAVKAKGTMKVDRTLYDIKFRSKKFFENLAGDKVIDDHFTVTVDLSASK